MWLVLAFLSAALLGFYDSFKKKALEGNAVFPVLFLNTFFRHSFSCHLYYFQPVPICWMALSSMLVQAVGRCISTFF